MYLGEGNLAQTCQNETHEELIHCVGLEIDLKDRDSRNLKIGILSFYF
jgi:hypothetical protein